MQVEPQIKSRPTYPKVELRPHVQQHLFVSTAEGFPVIRPLYEAAPEAERMLYLFDSEGEGEPVDADSHRLAELATVLNGAFSKLPLASALYVAGHEAFLWDVRNLALGAGMADEQIQLCAPVSNRRRLFCTHCYTLMEDVTHSPHVCTGCGRELLVRDHFSKLRGAYVGVQINAEDTSEQPAVEELS